MTEADANPQTVEVLTFLGDNGIKTAVGSSSKNAQLILDRLNYRQNVLLWKIHVRVLMRQ